MTSEYERYLRAEWRLFSESESRREATVEAVAGLNVTRVLDVGCGAGQELRPFVEMGSALTVGIDVAPDVGRTGRVLYGRETGGVTPAFLQGRSEALPFLADSFDVVISRGMLPYTNNKRTLAEMARVLRPGGAMLLKIAHARYYLWQMPTALRKRRPLVAVHDARVLLAGAVYHSSGRQPDNRILGSETFQTLWLLRRELSRYGLAIKREMPDTNPLTPSYLIFKHDPASDQRGQMAEALDASEPEPQGGDRAPIERAPEQAQSWGEQALKAANCLRWLPAYGWQRGTRRSRVTGGIHLVLAVADHFEPGIASGRPGSYATREQQERRLERWCRKYPRNVDRWRDDDGQVFRHTYFYPAEQYDRVLIKRLAEHCHSGWGEIEVQLHHGVQAADTAANTRRTLIGFRDVLSSHGCLSQWNGTGMPRYAFVRGNWALANSSRNRFCGVDDELRILAETGCYSDFTLPSAPSAA